MMAKNTTKPEEKPDDAQDDDAADEPAKLELTEQELNDRISAATAEAIKKDRAEQKKLARQKKKQQEEADEDEDAEDPAEVVRAAEAARAEAEQRAADAERRMLMAEVKDKLRDYLALNFKEFVNNTPDILLHIERGLSPDPKDAEIARLIESHAKAFVERTKNARQGQANPITVSRGRIAGIQQQAERREAKPEQPANRFSTINWHG